MEVNQGDFKFDIHSGKVTGQLAGRAPLDPSIFGEGVKVEVDPNIAWTPPPTKPVMPDMSEIKSIRKYFGRTEFPVWPAWFYHPTYEPVLCTEEMGATLGIRHRDATDEEKGRYGIKTTWDYAPDCVWRAYPYKTNMPGKFDPANPGHGKTYVPPDQAVTRQSALVADLVPAVAAAVAAALKSEGPGKPAHIDAKQWEDFLAFQAWQKTQAVLVEQGPVLGAGKVDPDRELWQAAAEKVGIKIDRRWSVERLKEKIREVTGDESFAPEQAIMDTAAQAPEGGKAA